MRDIFDTLMGISDVLTDLSIGLIQAEPMKKTCSCKTSGTEAKSQVKTKSSCSKSFTVPEIKTIGYSNKPGKGTVKVTFTDGTYTESHCAPSDTFDLRIGVALCICEKLFGSRSQFYKAIKQHDVTKFNNSPLNRENRRAHGKAKVKKA